MHMYSPADGWVRYEDREGRQETAKEAAERHFMFVESLHTLNMRLPTSNAQPLMVNRNL